MYQNVKEIREATGLSQRDFAKMYKIPLSTLRNWSRGPIHRHHMLSIC